METGSTHLAPDSFISLQIHLKVGNQLLLMFSGRYIPLMAFTFMTRMSTWTCAATDVRSPSSKFAASMLETASHDHDSKFSVWGNPELGLGHKDAFERRLDAFQTGLGQHLTAVSHVLSSHTGHNADPNDIAKDLRRIVEPYFDYFKSFGM